MEDTYIVEGGNKLVGDVELSGAKNIALKVLIAGLLFEGDVILERVPRIRDVDEVMNLIRALGGKVEFTGPNQVRLNADALKEQTLDLLFASKIRVSFMFFAPLLKKFRVAHIPNPGGCRLGARPIDRIIQGMEAIGIEVQYDSETGYFHAKQEDDASGTYRFEKVSHTGTELLIMLGAYGNGQITIENAALEPEIDDLIAFFNDAGADIRRDGNAIHVKGSTTLKQKKPFSITSDRNEAVTFAVLALTTRGDITLNEVPVSHLTLFHQILRDMGATVEEIDSKTVRYAYSGPLRAVNLETRPHPGFMTDWQPPMAILLTQAEGTSTIHERMFENRFSYVQEIQKLGAHIEYYQPEIENPGEYYDFNYEDGVEYQQAIRIQGPTELHNAVMKIADLRAGATLAIGALTASGKSILTGASHMERGYEHFIEKVKKIGGNMIKVSE